MLFLLADLLGLVAEPGRLLYPEEGVLTTNEKGTPRLPHKESRINVCELVASLANCATAMNYLSCCFVSAWSN